MFHVQESSKQTCSLLAVLSGCNAEYKPQKQEVAEDKPSYPFPEIVSSGRLEVQVLKRPNINELQSVLDSLQPNVVYLQGEQLTGDEIGSLVWDDVDLSSVEAVSELFASVLPTTVYLELVNGQKLAEALQAKGIPFVIYWKNTICCYAACNFRHALFSVIQSSPSHTWDAFQLAYASFRLHCFGNDPAFPDNIEKINSKLGPHILGEPPKINVPPPEVVPGDDEENPEDLPAIKIYDDDVNMKFLICGTAKTLDECLLRSLEDGLNALLTIEMRGSKLHNRVSAVPPPLQAGNFSRGVVTMRCDISTSSSSHISLLLSGSAQTCFDDQLLEDHIKSELIEKSLLTHAFPESEDGKVPVSEPRRSVSIACGAPVFEVSLKIPTWGSQVLRQLAPDISYRNLVALGIAGIQGLAVAAFEKDDTERLLFFCASQEKEKYTTNFQSCGLPSWLRPPAPRRRSHSCQEVNVGTQSSLVSENQVYVKKESEDGEFGLRNEIIVSTTPTRRKLRAAALRPIPHIRHRKMLPFAGISEIHANDGNLVKPAVHVAPSIKYNSVAAPANHRKSTSGSCQAKQVISLNPLPLKKHDCTRSPIHVCSEEEFLKDVMQFLILRGHTRLVPQGGLAEFPDAILNAKRLDLFNLYREVVSRGGFNVGNGINWKGQVFSKMRNHTATNKMTGVGNTLKRHYETYLLEYELAHDDVDGECCLLCRSSAAGDWVNCGTCGEWAHFGCDRRQGLGAFKDYAKTDGLEYICPQCSVSNYKKKMKTTNGFSQGAAY
ncbi:hypothetical protein LIER_05954 [Lithospermum erythrorhizon]|uniref:ARID domain-containing protein n=2 Tax=Magnoliopsida TaxID=3398 RepID=A0AAV3P3R6_LITER